MSLLEHIRTKPKEERTRYAFLVASIVTGIIAMVWITTIPARFTTHVQTLTQKQENKEKKDTSSGEPSVFDSFKDQFANTIASQKNEVDETTGDGVQSGSNNASSDSALTNLAPSPSLSTSSPATTTDSSINTEVVSTQPITATTSTAETVVTPPPPRIILIGTTTFQKSE